MGTIQPRTIRYLPNRDILVLAYANGKPDYLCSGGYPTLKALNEKDIGCGSGPVQLNVRSGSTCRDRRFRGRKRSADWRNHE